MNETIAQVLILKSLCPMAFRNERERSFDLKWHLYPLNPRDLAKNGLYFDGVPERPDQVKCIYCHSNFYDWKPNDDPKKEHRRLAPLCPVFGNFNTY